MLRFIFVKRKPPFLVSFFVKDGFGGDGTGYPSKLGALGDDRLRSRAREIDNNKKRQPQ